MHCLSDLSLVAELTKPVRGPSLSSAHTPGRMAYRSFLCLSSPPGVLTTEDLIKQHDGRCGYYLPARPMAQRAACWAAPRHPHR